MKEEADGTQTSPAAERGGSGLERLRGEEFHPLKDVRLESEATWRRSVCIHEGEEWLPLYCAWKGV